MGTRANRLYDNNVNALIKELRDSGIEIKVIDNHTCYGVKIKTKKGSVHLFSTINSGSAYVNGWQLEKSIKEQKSWLRL